MKRCSATTIEAGRRVRCNGNEGHFSAHHTERSQWPNVRGLPLEPRATGRRVRELGIRLIVAGIIVVGSVIGYIWILFSRR
jgi:hypothetical protein